jgi:hypothetical protein
MLLRRQVASTSYEGDADNLARWSGRGRVTFKSGATYDGAWSAGEMHGQGKLTFPDGISYEGEFQNNKLTGKGVSSPQHRAIGGPPLCEFAAERCTQLPALGRQGHGSAAESSRGCLPRSSGIGDSPVLVLVLVLVFSRCSRSDWRSGAQFGPGCLP